MYYTIILYNGFHNEIQIFYIYFIHGTLTNLNIIIIIAIPKKIQSCKIPYYYSLLILFDILKYFPNYNVNYTNVYWIKYYVFLINNTSLYIFIKNIIGFADNLIFHLSYNLMSIYTVERMLVKPICPSYLLFLYE